MWHRPTALIADDEPLLRESLARQLGEAWPEVEVVAQARNGREAVKLFEEHRPDVCFLDVHMPGMSGIEAARQIGRRAHLVFVTAYHEYAVEAFAHGVLDYLVKPVEPARLAETVARLEERLAAALPAANTEELLQQLAAKLESRKAPERLRWVRAQVGPVVRLIEVDQIDYLRSDRKYTLVAWRADGDSSAQSLVRTPLKELVAQLDPEEFVRVHRAVVVNLRSVSHVRRLDNETAEIHLKGRAEVLPLSRGYLHLFRQM
jgi:DNA-binding LytR/AlgR family response regulator